MRRAASLLCLAGALLATLGLAPARVALVVFLIGFHVMTYAGVQIIFLPHCVAILSILPWERLPGAARWLRSRARGVCQGRASASEVSAAESAAPPG